MNGLAVAMMMRSIESLTSYKTVIQHTTRAYDNVPQYYALDTKNNAYTDAQTRAHNSALRYYSGTKNNAYTDATNSRPSSGVLYGILFTAILCTGTPTLISTLLLVLYSHDNIHIISSYTVLLLISYLSYQPNQNSQ